MNVTLKNRNLSTVQVVLTAALCLFSLASIPFVLANGGGTFGIFYCLATIPFVSLPLLLSVAFQWRLSHIFYIVFSLYAMGPLFGAVYRLYFITTWWDDLLHVLAGTIFAICGTYLAYVLNRGNKTSFLLAVCFGLCFSLGIAVLWELFEYSSDLFLGSDMQTDTVIHSIATKLGSVDGSLTVFEGIGEVTLDGRPLGLGGYLDIGLIDTMRDMAVETGGALLYLIYALVDRDRHPMVRFLRKEEKAAV